MTWFDDAACKGRNVDDFFPVRGQNVPADIRAMCNACPVKQQCLDYAMELDIDTGVWGGTSERQRRAIRAEWWAARGGRPPARNHAPCGTNAGYAAHYRRGEFCVECFDAHNTYVREVRRRQRERERGVA